MCCVLKTVDRAQERHECRQSDEFDVILRPNSDPFQDAEDTLARLSVGNCTSWIQNRCCADPYDRPIWRNDLGESDVTLRSECLLQLFRSSNGSAEHVVPTFQREIDEAEQRLSIGRTPCEVGQVGSTEVEEPSELHRKEDNGKDRRQARRVRWIHYDSTEL